MPGKSSSDLTVNLGDYLEAIHHLESEKRVARAKDIADRLEVTRASVTGMLKALSGRGLIYYEPYSFVTLTPEGNKAAKDLIHRHQVLSNFFESVLLLDPETAERNAYRGKHFIDKAATDQMVRMLDYRETDQGKACLEGFEKHIQSPPKKGKKKA
jgi:DtxR family Mn-dependent transcriptional regulator